MAPYIYDIHAICLFVPSAIHSADFIMEFTNGRIKRSLTGYFLAIPTGMAISLEKSTVSPFRIPPISISNGVMGVTPSSQIPL